jgi:hypothetical protein
MALPWRFRPADAIFAAAFLTVGACAWWKARPVALGDLLARENLGVTRAMERKEAEPLLPPPASAAEAGAQLKVYARWLDADRAAGWDALQKTVDRRGTPETRAAFARVWRDYRAAAGRLQEVLADWASAREEADPALTARKSEDYLAAVNALENASDALTQWALRLSAADFD